MGYRLLSVVMPAYNEGFTLRAAVRRVFQTPLPLAVELIIVDDGSTDHTPEVLEELAAADERIRVLRHERNLGKGAAVRTAVQHLAGDIVVIQDADLEYDPADLPALIAPIIEGKADAVFGTRFAAAGQRRVLFYWNTVANHFLTWLTNVLNDVNLTDMSTGYKAVRADILRQIPLRSDRFGIEPELATRLAQWNARIYEVPVSYHGRTRAEGKKIGLLDAVDVLYSLLKFRLWDTQFTTHDGYYILESVRKARRFNRWMFRELSPFVGQRVLEAGCGIGNFTEMLLDRRRVVCVDLDPFYVETISRRFANMENVRPLRADLAGQWLREQMRDERIDSIICLNVLEHIQDDMTVLRAFFDMLQDGGHAVLLVPGHPWLYTPCDQTLGHFRRYTPRELCEKMRSVGFEVVQQRQFNRLGVLGWWLSGRMGKATLSPGQMKMYERLLPLAKLIDRVGVGPGLSVIAVGRKPMGAARQGEGSDPSGAGAAEDRVGVIPG